jgi:hypothetical protein
MSHQPAIPSDHQSRNARKFFHGQYILKPADDFDFIETASKSVAKKVREHNRKGEPLVAPLDEAAEWSCPTLFICLNCSSPYDAGRASRFHVSKRHI